MLYFFQMKKREVLINHILIISLFVFYFLFLPILTYFIDKIGVEEKFVYFEGQHTRIYVQKESKTIRLTGWTYLVEENGIVVFYRLLPPPRVPIAVRARRDATNEEIALYKEVFPDRISFLTDLFRSFFYLKN